MDSLAGETKKAKTHEPGGTGTADLPALDDRSTDSPSPSIPTTLCSTITSSRTIHAYLLRSIFIHLPTADLARCLRANRRFFDVAGPILYRHVAYGREVTSMTAKVASIITGVDDQSAPPSATKLALLAHVRSLELHAHMWGSCRHLPRMNLLRNLETLSLVCNEDTPQGWGINCEGQMCSLIVRARPSQVQLVDRRELPLGTKQWRVSLERFTAATAVSVYASGLETARSGRQIAVEWPPAMRSLDIYYQRFEPLSSKSVTWHPSQSPITSEVSAAITSLSELAGSARALDADIRIIGLDSVIGRASAVGPGGAGYFAGEVKREYKAALSQSRVYLNIKKVEDPKEIDRKVEKLGFVPLAAFGEEGGVGRYSREGPARMTIGEAYDDIPAMV